MRDAQAVDAVAREAASNPGDFDLKIRLASPTGKAPESTGDTGGGASESGVGGAMEGFTTGGEFE